MSAIRYCGTLRIRVTYVEAKAPCHAWQANGSYRCVIRCLSEPGSAPVVQYVGAPAYLEHAVDSPEAFDQAAHAALSFAADDGFPLESYAEFSDSGWAIRRRK